MCVSTLPACMCVYHMYVWQSDDDTDGCKPPGGCWEPNPGPLKEQQVLNQLSTPPHPH